MTTVDDTKNCQQNEKNYLPGGAKATAVYDTACKVATVLLRLINIKQNNK